jgi:hypothetical protein
MRGSSFTHIVTYKCIHKQYHVRKRKIIRDLRLILETKAPNITGSRLGVAYAQNSTTSSHHLRVASSFWATLFIARVSTCRTQQVWEKEWMQRLYSGLGYKHLSNFSWSSFISTWLLIKYKFIPTHNYHKEIDKIRHKHMATITREHDLSPSSSSIIMWGSRPLLTMSTANQLVLHSAEVVHLYPQVT